MRAATVRRAMDDLAALPQTRVTARSSLYRSAPVDAGGPGLHQRRRRARDRRCDPQALLAELQRLEAAAGRERPYRNAPRTLDLDLLRHGDAAHATRRR